MKRPSLYSSSSRGRRPRTAAASQPVVTQADTVSAPTPAREPGRVSRTLSRFRGALSLVAGAAIALVVVALHGYGYPPARELTQKDIDAAVLRTLETKPLPARAAKAYEVIRQSVVRVRGLGADGEKDMDDERSVGTGVVITDDGTILTNLHVVADAKRIGVIFADGHQTEATVVAVRAEHDLAVIRPKTVPDDLVVATLRSTADLRQGDEVVAVGFPFGIGPSVSWGVISGLRREYHSPEGKQLLTNLIQFDAAANPGSSGGPLITADGEVVGIVTGILNPGKEPVFIGIGFAVPIENAASAVGLAPF